MPEAPRVLIALQPSMYAEVLAFLVGQNRPRAEVSLLDPSEDLEEAARSARPHLLVANGVPKSLREDPHFFFWVEVDEARAGGGPKRLGARISADGYSQSVGDVKTEHVLLALDHAEEELLLKVPGRARGVGTS